MFTVASYLVEQMSGLSFEDFLHKHFFTPLEMTSTHLQPDAAIAAGLEDRMATQYAWRADETYMPVERQQVPEAQGAGSIFTSANDYIKWVKAVMNKEHPVTEDVYRGLIKPRIIENPNAIGDELEPFTSPSFYGAGLESFYYRGYLVMKHDGLIDGSGSCHFFVPDFKFGGVILANADSASDLGTIIAHELVDEVLQVPKDERPDWNSRQHKLDSDEDGPSKDEQPTLGTQGQDMDLNMYTGQYWNPGYKGMKVEIKNDALFVDATDRSVGFTLTFENLGDKTKFTAELSSYLEPGIDNDKLEAEFRFRDEKVVQMGIKLEDNLNGLIWFDKLDN